MKLFFVYLSPGSCHLLSLKSKHSLQHPFHKDPNSICLSIFFNIILEFTTILSFKNCLWCNQLNTMDNVQNTSQSYCNKPTTVSLSFIVTYAVPRCEGVMIVFSTCGNAVLDQLLHSCCRICTSVSVLTLVRSIRISPNGNECSWWR